MRNLRFAALIAAAGLAAATPSISSAQATGNAADSTYMAAPVQEDDDDFPWGLLGLLGLAGLLGRKRSDDHVNVDNRTRP